MTIIRYRWTDNNKFYIIYNNYKYLFLYFFNINFFLKKLKYFF